MRGVALSTLIAVEPNEARGLARSSTPIGHGRVSRLIKHEPRRRGSVAAIGRFAGPRRLEWRTAGARYVRAPPRSGATGPGPRPGREPDSGPGSGPGPAPRWPGAGPGRPAPGSSGRAPPATSAA